MALSYEQAKLVKGTIPALKDHGERITTIFYRNMLLDHPELNNYFNIVNQANGRQPRALTSVMLTFANSINHTADLAPKLERMCQKHCSLGIQPEQYEIVGKYLIGAFAEVLGPAMTPEARAAWLKAYWMLAKMLIGRETQLYRQWDGWQGWKRFRIGNKIEESDDICSLYLVPEDGIALPDFFPGQFISLRVNVTGIGFLQARQYSLSDRPRRDYYRITIRRDDGARLGRQSSRYLSDTCSSIPGIVSNILINQKNVGDIVELTHPAGSFFLDTNNTSSTPIVLISAGVGVTPMMSILNYVAKRQPTRPVSWIHGSRSSVPFSDQVQRIQRDMPNLKTNIFKTHLAESDLAGVTHVHDYRIDLAKVRPEDLWLKHSAAEYFVCGPEQFMVEMAHYLQDHGVASIRIKLELFSTGDAQFQADAAKVVSGKYRNPNERNSDVSSHKSH